MSTTEGTLRALALRQRRRRRDAARSASSPGPRTTTGWRSWVTTVDHKKIGIMYGAAALFFFVIGGIEALLIRAPAGGARTARCCRADALQPGVHDARHDDGLPRRHADRRGVRQLPDAAADRRPRRRLPPHQRLQLLVLPLRRHLPQHAAGSSAAAPTAAGSTTPRTAASSSRRATASTSGTSA